MKERPILFSALMVRAILAGTKTQTRRVVRDSVGVPEFWTHGAYEPCCAEGDTWTFRCKDGAAAGYAPTFRCPYGQPGDRLWVRETFWQGEVAGEGEGVPFLFYDADQDGGFHLHFPHRWEGETGKWGKRPSIFMPRWASRLTLRVTAIRAQRVQEISEADAKAEGCPGVTHACGARGEYAMLWDSINGKRPGCSWAENPWVWALTFRRVEAACG